MTKLAVNISGRVYDIDVDWSPQDGAQIEMQINGEPARVYVPDLDLSLERMDWIVVDDRPYEIVFDLERQWLKAWGGIHRFEVRDQDALAARPRSGDGRVRAPIPGLVSRLLVAEGEVVEAGQPLLVLEAMKMENEIRAPRAGTVVEIAVTPGQTVAGREFLAEIA